MRATVPAETLAYGPVVLHRWRTSDADELYRLVHDALDHLRPWMPWVAGHSLERTKEFTARCERTWISGGPYEYAITSKGVIVGSCGLVRLANSDWLDSGYWLAPPYTGRGLATSAVAALTCQAFELPGIEGVEIDHDVLNHASRGIPERLGFARSHVRTRAPQVPGESGVHQIWRLDRAAFMRRTW
ncbi:GNAT family N-acetyltransferase [Streptomyces sp. NPDC048290]|uniref:GNAT family N-acetyltransferase n=1 Tax=Streptomyces sp. NPDC048290 TaxID=3155811 RepID=UPI003429E622